ncbi:hypothetical protein QYF61_014107, partial [Mycteria americana]
MEKYYTWGNIILCYSIETSHMLGCTRKAIPSGSREVILLYSTLKSPPLTYCVQFWLLEKEQEREEQLMEDKKRKKEDKKKKESAQKFWTSQYKTDVTILEQVQQKAPKMINGLEYLTNEERLRELQLFSLERGSLSGILSMNVYKYLVGGSKEDGGRLFSVVPSDNTQGIVHELTYRKFHLIIKRLFFVHVCDWATTGTGFPERLWCLHLWRYSET